ncbi:MAG: penicillin-binding transpeptidase domain-containing protein, partial [Bacteroidota bacterium]|nr:penicillin-binding transpeptidase domain-containing protein [Bacteroidota bacterium]
MAVRDEIVFRSGIVYFVIVIMAAVLLGRILFLQFVQRGKWTAMSEKYVFKTDEEPANRGDILACDGRLLASSVPYYSIYMDTRSTGMSARIWSEGIDGLSEGLARLLGVRSAAGWKEVLTRARKRGDRFFLIKKKVDYATLKKVKALPIFREGRYRGGFVVQAENRRILPQSQLAARTIGYLSLAEEGTQVGLEGSFNRELAGKNGIVVKQRLTGGDWITVNDPESIDSEDGNDILTTIDIDLQDVAASALENQLRKHNAHHGCAVLMEVETGDIRAIANLEQDENGNYRETYNYAIAESTEPGSTFKLPVLMAAI